MLLGYFPEPWDILFQSNNGVNNTQGFYQYLEFGYFEDGSKTLPDFHTRNLLFFQYLEVSSWNSWIATLYPQNPVNSVPGPKMGEIPPQQLVGMTLEFLRLSRLEMRRGKLKSTQSPIEVPNILVPSETKFSGFLLDSRSKGSADSGSGNQEKVAASASMPWLDNQGTLLCFWGEKRNFFHKSQEMRWPQKMQLAQFWLDFLINGLLVEKLGGRSHFFTRKRRRCQCNNDHLTSICF